jgi:hypothetical protein
MAPTTVSIWKAAAEEHFVHFQNREEAYIWALLFMQRWGKNPHYSPYEKNDSCVWGSPIANDSYFDVFMFNGHRTYDRSNSWYSDHDVGFRIVDEVYALKCGPCQYV